MSRSARRARSDNSADQNDKNYVKSSSVVQQSTMIPFTTNSSPSSSTLKDGSSSRMLSGSTESQHVPEATQVEAFLFDSGIISTKIVSQQQPESSGPT